MICRRKRNNAANKRLEATPSSSGNYENSGAARLSHTFGHMINRFLRIGKTVKAQEARRGKRMIGRQQRTPKDTAPCPATPRPDPNCFFGGVLRMTTISKNLMNNQIKARTTGFTAYAVPGAAE
jgi:hypothetical protein